MNDRYSKVKIMLNNLLSIFVPLLLSLFLTPLMMVIARRRRIFDVPDK